MPITRESFEIIFDADVNVENDGSKGWPTDWIEREGKLKELLTELGFENVDIWKIEWL